MAHQGVTMADTQEQAPIEVNAKDLPVFCPNPRMPLWSSHPRVFLELDDAGLASCPYCGTRYRLVGGSPKAGH